MSGLNQTPQISQAFKVGCPIRRSMDQSSFAAPHGLSQRITSFIACACQGIHQMPLKHLIVLIANAHLYWVWNTYPPRLRSKGFQTWPHSKPKFAAPPVPCCLHSKNTKNPATFYNQVTSDAIDVSVWSILRQKTRKTEVVQIIQAHQAHTPSVRMAIP